VQVTPLMSTLASSP